MKTKPITLIRSLIICFGSSAFLVGCGSKEGTFYFVQDDGEVQVMADREVLFYDSSFNGELLKLHNKSFKSYRKGVLTKIEKTESEIKSLKSEIKKITDSIEKEYEDYSPNLTKELGAYKAGIVIEYDKFKKTINQRRNELNLDISTKKKNLENENITLKRVLVEVSEEIKNYESQSNELNLLEEEINNEKEKHLQKTKRITDNLISKVNGYIKLNKLKIPLIEKRKAKPDKLDGLLNEHLRVYASGHVGSYDFDFESYGVYLFTVTEDFSSPKVAERHPEYAPGKSGGIFVNKYPAEPSGFYRYYYLDGFFENPLPDELANLSKNEYFKWLNLVTKFNQYMHNTDSKTKNALLKLIPWKNELPNSFLVKIKNEISKVCERNDIGKEPTEADRVYSKIINTNLSPYIDTSGPYIMGQHRGKLYSLQEQKPQVVYGYIKSYSDILKIQLEKNKSDLSNLPIDLLNQMKELDEKIKAREISFNNQIKDKENDVNFKISQEDVLIKNKIEELTSSYNIILSDKMNEVDVLQKQHKINSEEYVIPHYGLENNILNISIDSTRTNIEGRFVIPNGVIYMYAKLEGFNGKSHYWFIDLIGLNEIEIRNSNSVSYADLNQHIYGIIKGSRK